MLKELVIPCEGKSNLKIANFLILKIKNQIFLNISHMKSNVCRGTP